MAERPDLISGRKQLLYFFGIENWKTVERYIIEGCPIGMLGGRWTGQRHLLLQWMTERQNGGKQPVNFCKSLQLFTGNDSAQATRSKWRSGRMGTFLQAYKEGGGLISPACRAAGISRVSYHTWRKRFERFDTACKHIENEVFHGNNHEESGY